MKSENITGELAVPETVAGLVVVTTASAVELVSGLGGEIKHAVATAAVIDTDKMFNYRYSISHQSLTRNAGKKFVYKFKIKRKIKNQLSKSINPTLFSSK